MSCKMKDASKSSNNYKKKQKGPCSDTKGIATCQSSKLSPQRERQNNLSVNHLNY